MHILIKSSHPDFRDVLKDAQALFAQGNRTLFTLYTGYDLQRLFSWKIDLTSHTFAGYPVQICHLVEDYPKRTTRPSEEAWIVTTGCSLSPQKIREAAHICWSIENDCFKKLSTLAGTKRFPFKDPKPFLTMLSIFCFSITAFELCLYMVHHPKKD